MESGLTEFFQQLPPILPIALCGSGLLLLVVIVMVVMARARRPRPDYLVASLSTPHMAATSELPDLDLLLGDAPAAPAAAPPMPAMAEAAPVRPSAPVPAPDPLPEQPPTPAVSTSADRGGTYTVELTSGRRVEAAEVMTIARDLADGGLIIQIGARAYRNPTEIDNEATRRRFNATVRELARQAMNADKQTGAKVPAPDAGSAPPPISATGAMPGDLPKFRTDETPLLAPRKRKQPPPPVPDLNIADAIETYLQYRLSHTPEYSGRSIHVHAAPGGGVAIEVDGQFYETVGEVDNDDVRDFLANTIEEWQSRQ